jgi:hypothetical protein
MLGSLELWNFQAKTIREVSIGLFVLRHALRSSALTGALMRCSSIGPPSQKTGDPNGTSKLPSGPKFDVASRSYIEFTDEGPVARDKHADIIQRGKDRSKPTPSIARSASPVRTSCSLHSSPEPRFMWRRNNVRNTNPCDEAGPFRATTFATNSEGFGAIWVDA